MLTTLRVSYLTVDVSIIRRALAATRLYLAPFELYCLARMYAEYTPFLLILHVPRLQIGNVFFAPKKHDFGQCAIMLVRWWIFGLSLAQPFHGRILRVLPRPRRRLVCAILIYCSRKINISTTHC